MMASSLDHKVRAGDALPRCAVLLAIGIAFVAHTYGFRLDQVYAARGFSILEVVEAHADPQAFARDFPGGARMTTAASPLVHIYIALHERLGIDPLAANYAMIFLELLFVAGGSFLLWSSLAQDAERPSSPDRLQAWIFPCLLTIILVSDLQRPNLAAFGFPFFHGQFYGFADGLRLAGIALVLKRRWITAALVLSLCFIIHPIKAILAMAFLVPALLLDWRILMSLRCLLSIAATLAVSAFWYGLVLARGPGGVPLQEFVEYTRLLQSHWYPFENGVLGTRHDRYLSPFIALTLMSFAALGHTGWSRRLQLKMALGLIMLLGITTLGIWISEQARSATLIRICLIRASTLVTLLAPFILMSAALSAWRRKRWMIAAACLAFQGAAFFGPGQMAPLFAIVFAAISLPGSDVGRVARWLIAGLSVVVALASLWLWHSYPRSADPLSAALPLLLGGVLFWALVFRLPVRLKRETQPQEGMALVHALVAGAFLLGGVVWTSGEVHRISDTQEEARAYHETQIWARQNTASGSLFMVDPCRWYGWRDFSGRASLGTLREWYMTGWIYTDDGGALEKGKKIAQSLGFDIGPFLGSGNRSGIRRDLCASAREAYYRQDMQGQKAVSKDFGVDYFVFELEHSGTSLDAYASDLVFRNEYFALLPAEALR